MQNFYYRIGLEDKVTKVCKYPFHNSFKMKKDAIEFKKQLKGFENFNIFIFKDFAI